MTTGTIMAGGRGSRMTGATTQKPLLTVCGQPLIDHIVDSFVSADITDIFVATDDDNTELMEHLSLSYPTASFSLVPTQIEDGTGGAVLKLLAAVRGNDTVLATADTVLRRATVKRLLSHVASAGTDVLVDVLATTYVHDEKPIWVEINSGGQVLEFSKTIGPRTHVFGNVRWFSSAVLQVLPAYRGLSRPFKDSLLMSSLLADYPRRVTAMVEDPVFDIDRPIDIVDVERWVQRNATQWAEG